MKITAVVVTYNRLELLKKVIEALKIQSRPLDKIIVVNNGSTDGTTEWLEQQDGLCLVHQENLGGAGGFARGIQEAFDDNADWIWTMDDDVMPSYNCLEEIIPLTAFSECIQPLRMSLSNREVGWEQFYDVRNNHIITTLQNDSFRKGKTHCFVNTVCFEGMFISNRVAREAGVPDTDFFICYDDSIYGLYVNQFTNILFAKNAVMYSLKKDGFKVSNMYLYYSIRNFHLIKKHVKLLNLGNISTIGYFHFWANVLVSMSSAIIKLQFSRAFAVFKGVRDCHLKKVGKSY